MGVTQLQEHIEQLKGAATSGSPVDDDQGTDEPDDSQKKSLSPPASRLATNPLDPSP